MTETRTSDTTRNAYTLEICKLLRKDIEIHGWVQYDGWKEPLYKTGVQRDTSTAFRDSPISTRFEVDPVQVRPGRELSVAIRTQK
jgi:hypothetical protein